MGGELGLDPFEKIGVGVNDKYGLDLRHWVGWVGGERSEAAVSPSSGPELGDGGVKISFAEVRPEFWGDVEFGVAELPEQEVGEAHLA